MRAADGHHEDGVVKNEIDGTTGNAVQAQSIDGGVHFSGLSEGLVRELVKPISDALDATSRALNQNDRYISHLEGQVRDGLVRELALCRENARLRYANDTVMAIFTFLAEAGKALFLLRWNDDQVEWMAIAVGLVKEDFDHARGEVYRRYEGFVWGVFENPEIQIFEIYASADANEDGFFSEMRWPFEAEGSAIRTHPDLCLGDFVVKIWNEGAEKDFLDEFQGTLYGVIFADFSEGSYCRYVVAPRTGEIDFSRVARELA